VRQRDSNNGLRGAINAFSRTVLVAFVMLGAGSLVSLQILRVNGPVYQRIVLGKDLVADILPPPEYVIEAYLETTLALDSGADLLRHARRLKALEADYRLRHDYWESSKLTPDLKQQILVTSDRPAQAFWKEVNTSFLPALQRGDTEAARDSYRAITAQYEIHRAAVDALVVAANAEGARTEAFARNVLLAFAGLMAMLAAVLIFVVRRSAARIIRDVTDPLGDMTGAMTVLSGGNLEVSIPHAERRDEVGAMARALSVFRDQGRETGQLRRDQEAARAQQESARLAQAAEQTRVVEGLAAGLAGLAAGDLTTRIEQPFGGAYDRLREDFNAAADKLDGALSRVRENTDGILWRVDQIASANTELSRRTVEQAESAEQTGRTLQGIADAVRQSARATAQASQAVVAAKIDAERSDGVITSTVTAMSEIVESTHQIGQIVEVIDGIAFQTNLLALNAGVEAARAGDSGRGFAVVATEVRALAQHTAGRAKDINVLIRTSKELVDSGKDYVTGTGDTLRRIVVQVGDLAEFVSRIAEATQEQAGRLGDVHLAASEMELTTQQNARMAEDCNEAVSQLQGEAADLRDIVGRFVITRLADNVHRTGGSGGGASARFDRAGAA
jgi:methyl-accepting chemotaxis protein